MLYLNAIKITDTTSSLSHFNNLIILNLLNNNYSVYKLVNNLNSIFYNLKIAGSNPTLKTTYFIKAINYKTTKDQYFCDFC